MYNDQGIEESYVSLVYGNGTYLRDVNVSHQNWMDETYSVLINQITKERFFLRIFACNDKTVNQLRMFVLTPPALSNILWPIDIVRPTHAKVYHDSAYLLFPYETLPQLTSAKDILSNIDVSWKHSEIRKMVVSILICLQHLNQQHYLYCDLSLENLYFTKDHEPFFDFSTYIFSEVELSNKKKQLYANKYAIEFAEPALVQKKIQHFDYASQNYSIAALLFYFFFHRHAYDGRLLDDMLDQSVHHHQAKFQKYHQMPVFIFDPHDQRNYLGTFDDEQRIWHLWDAFPKGLKERFIMVLKEQNATRVHTPNNLTPMDWLSAFQEVGWIHAIIEQGGDGSVEHQATETL